MCLIAEVRKDIDHIKYVLTLTRELGINLAGVDLILQLKDKIEILENDVEKYKNQLQEANRFGVVPSSKALVIKKSSYDVVIFEE